MALTQITEKGIKDGELVNADINASAAIAGSKLAASTTSVAGSMSAADKTKLDGIAASANNYTHPNHSGDVTSSADGATTIADNAVTNAKMADDAVGVAELSATGTASSSTFLRGDNSWVTPTDTNTQLAFANDANNRVVTGDGSGGLNGEANLTFDGTHLNLGNTGSNWVGPLNVGTGTSGNAQVASIYSNSDTYGGLWFADGTSGADRYVGAVNYYHTDNSLRFDANGAERVRIDSSGRVGIGTASPAENFHINSGGASCIQRFQTSSYDSYIGTVHTAGNFSNNSVAGQLFLRGQGGIGFSANAGGASQAKITSDGLCFGSDTAAANALSDYEEGSWNASIAGAEGGGPTSYSGSGQYTKVGRLVTITVAWSNITFPGLGGQLEISLPFTSANSGGAWFGGDCYYYPNSVWDDYTDFIGMTPHIPANSNAIILRVKLKDSDRQTTQSAGSGGRNGNVSEATGVYLSFSMTYWT